MKNNAGGQAGRLPSPAERPRFGSLLRAARIRKNLSQDELAGIMGVSRYTIINWEADKNRPDVDTFLQLCAALGLSLRDLFPEESGLSRLERSVVENLRLLKPQTRELVKAMVFAMAEAAQSAHAGSLRESVKVVSLYSGSLAAGTAGGGSYFAEEPASPFFLRVSDRTAKADAVIRISGRSMEPVYHDGDYVYFQYAASAGPGEDAVVAWAGQQYVKRISEDGTLYSINPDYPFAYDGCGDDIRIMGRVLGIVSTVDRAGKDDLPLLEELFSAELAGFE